MLLLRSIRRWLAGEWNARGWVNGAAEGRSLEPPLEVTRGNLKRFNIAADPARINRTDVTEKRVGNPGDSRFLAETKESEEVKAKEQSFRSYKNRVPFSERPQRI